MTTEDFRLKVKAALERSGYPLEMHVAKHFRAVGFEVTQSEYYGDTSSGQHREIDVVAYGVKRLTTDLRETVSMVLAIECKSSRDKPWVLFVGHPELRSGRTWQIDFTFGAVGNNRGRLALHAMFVGANFPDLPVFSDQRQPAYGLVQVQFEKGGAPADGRDASHTALMQACKAAVALTREITEKENLLWGVIKNMQATIGIPVIVLDGRLFTAGLDANGDLVVTETTHGAVMVQNPDTGTTKAQVFVVTKDKLPEFVGGMAMAFSLIADWCVEHRTEIVELWNKRDDDDERAPR